MTDLPAARKGDARDWYAVYESEVLPFVERPSRYINHEVNSVQTDWNSARLRVALVFPDAREVGASHLGLKILYGILNAIPGVLAERCYAPWIDAEQILREKRIPLCSLESCRPLNAFHLIGFSIQYELCYTNLLAILDLAGIPVRATERWDRPGPLIVAGGNVCAPGPLEPFVDAFALGDGEATVQRIAKWALKRLGSGAESLHAEPEQDRLVPCRKLLADLVRTVPGIYAPALYPAISAGDVPGRLCPTEPRIQNIPFPVRKEYIADISTAPTAEAPVVPFCEAVHDRAQVEIMRGCVRGCRFCQAGMITRPVREKQPDKVVEEVLTVIANTGYEQVTLASLSAGDYSSIAQVLRALLDPSQLPAMGTAVALPSLRLDSFDPAMAETIKRVRRTGFTFAPEAGSERLRRVINKSLARDEILDTVQSVIDAGWKRVKVYFMIGLPTETMEDIEALVGLVKQMIDLRQKGTGRRAQVNLSVSTFVPKAFTPFQWAAFAPLDEIREKQQYILRHLPRKRVKINFHRLELSRLEAVFARGDRRLADVVENAFRLGCRFDEWSDRLDVGKWETAFADAGVNPEDYLAAIPECAPLPWEVLDYGVTREFLLREWRRALEEKPTPSCRSGPCAQCGLQRWDKSCEAAQRE